MPNRKNLVVLVAEDHPVNKKVLGLLLDSLGVAVDYANDGQEAIEAATRHNYGLILMDCIMPNVDGFQAAYEIRRFEFHNVRHTPIIACTSLDKDSIVDQCLRAGINDYIAKPLDRKILKEKIAYWSVISMALGPIAPAVAAQIRRLEASDAAEPIDCNYLNVLYGVQQLDDVLNLFMTVTSHLLGELEEAIQHHNIAIVKRMVHEIKGSSYTVGAREMAQVCQKLEHESQDQDWPELEKLYVSLGLAFARVRGCLEDKANVLGVIRASAS